MGRGGRELRFRWEAKTVTEATNLTADTPAPRFRPYRDYRDSGVEWLGGIPSHWEVKKWRYCCHVTGGQISPDDEGFRQKVLIAPNHIESGTGRLLHLETAHEQGAISGKYLVAPGDIIYSKIRPALNKACISTGDWLCSADMYPVSITESRLETRFLLYFMLSAPFVQLMVDQSMRVAMPKVNRDKLAACPLLVPDPVEQRAIADFLDRETAKIDALVARKERLIELLQEKRTALITRAVTRGLDPNVLMKDSGVEWLGEVPAHWGTKRIKRLFRHRKRQGFPEQTVLSVYRDYGVIEKSSRDDNFNRTPEDLDTYQLVNPGDLVINKMKAWQGSLGISSLSGITSPDYVVYTPDHEENDRFLHHFLRCKLFASVYLTISNGIRPSQWRIEPERFENLVVFLPPPAEQDQIATFVDAETTKIDALVAKVYEALDCLMEFRTALISAAVTGQIDVREAVAR